MVGVAEDYGRKTDEAIAARAIPTAGANRRAALVVDIRRIASDVVITTFISRPPVELEPHSPHTERLRQFGPREVPTARARDCSACLQRPHSTQELSRRPFPFAPPAVRTGARVL